jgi:hypothetical protein
MHNYNEIRKRNPKFVFTAPAAVITAVMLLGTTAISTLTTAESVFAYRNNQATSSVNDCGNGSSPQNVGCQNTGSQIQGDKNTVSLSSQQTFPGANTCVGCFNSLSDKERADFEEMIPMITEGQASTIEELCAFLETLDFQQQEITLVLVAVSLLTIGVDVDTVIDIRGCLIDVLGLTPTT